MAPAMDRWTGTLLAVLMIVGSGCQASRWAGGATAAAAPAVVRPSGHEVMVFHDTPPPPPEVVAAAFTQPPPPEATAKTDPQPTTPGTAAPPQLPELPDTVPSPDSGLALIKALNNRASDRLNAMPGYWVRFRRREVVNGVALPEDLAMVHIARNPFSLHTKSLPGSPTEGREMIYVQGKFNNQIQVRTGKGDLLAGVRLAIDPHSPRATLNSRRLIYELGLDNIVNQVNDLCLAQIDGRINAVGPIHYLPSARRPGSLVPVEGVHHQIAAGRERLLPQGGKRWIYYCADPQSMEYGLPIHVVTHDAQGREVENYSYDRLVRDPHADPRDFDPAVVWN